MLLMQLGFFFLLGRHRAFIQVYVSSRSIHHKFSSSSDPAETDFRIGHKTPQKWEKANDPDGSITVQCPAAAAATASTDPCRRKQLSADSVRDAPRPSDVQ
jgi:hypothetical protein